MGHLGDDDYGELASQGATRSIWGRRHMTPVSQQSGTRSCVAFSVGAALSALVQTKHFFYGEIATDLSKQEMIDCIPIPPDGTSFTAGYDYVLRHGLYREVDYKYEGAHNRPCRCSILYGLPRVSFWSYEVLRNTTDVLSALEKQPLTAGMDLFQSFNDHKWTRKSVEALMDVYHPMPGERPLVRENGTTEKHAVLVTGYGIRGHLDYFVIKNSDGVGWGINGYARVTAGLLYDFGRPGEPRIQIP